MKVWFYFSIKNKKKEKQLFTLTLKAPNEKQCLN